MLFKKNQRADQKLQFQRININRGNNSDIRRRPVRDIDQHDESLHSVPLKINKNNILTVHQPEEYAKLESILIKRLEMIIENINISRDKNKLKDKEIQIIAQTIQKANEKIHSIELKIGQRQKMLNSISLKCHDKTTKSSKGQEKIKKQSILLVEETSKCQSLQADIKYIQQKNLTAERQLQNCKKMYNNLDQIQEQNQQLRQQFGQLKNQQKMIEYRQANQKHQCQQIQKKLEELKNIYKQRSKINKRNLIKLNTLKKQFRNIEDSNNLMHIKVDQIKNLQLELGELNQELLLFNEGIAQFDFKIRKKQKNISDLREKLKRQKNQSNSINNQRKQPNKIVQSEEQASKTDPYSSKNSRNNSANKNSQQLSVNSKNASPGRNRSNLTPTFPSNDIQGNVLNANNMQSAEQMPNDAFKNIQKLINRFEQIKNKDKLKL